MNTEERIAYSVAFKGVIALAAAGEVEFETNDIVAETIELADAFYEAIAVRTGLDEEEEAPKARKKSTKKSKRGSGKRASSRSGSTKKKKSGTTAKDPNADASAAQIGFLKKLLGENDIDFDDDGFEMDDEEYWFDEFTMGTIQDPIEELKS